MTTTFECPRKSEAPQTTYDYDALGNLDSVELPDGTEIAYLTDGLGRRIGREVDGQLTHGFLYGADALGPAAELSPQGAVRSRFVYATSPYAPDYMVRQGSAYRLVRDQLGSVRLVVDAETGQVAQEITYGPFGEVLSDTNPGFQPFGFAGGLYDLETGLVRFGARDYDPETGRWTAKDPILFAGGQANLYGYVLNDPVNLVDPSGLLAPLVVAIAGGAILGGGASAGIYALSDACDKSIGAFAEQAAIGAAGGAVGGGIGGPVAALLTRAGAKGAVATISGGASGGAAAASVEGALRGGITSRIAIEGALSGSVGAGFRHFLRGQAPTAPEGQIPPEVQLPPAYGARHPWDKAIDEGAEQSIAATGGVIAGSLRSDLEPCVC